MRRALPFLVATVALLVPATARAADPPTCNDFLLDSFRALVTVPGETVSVTDPCGPGSYTLQLDSDNPPANGDVSFSGTTVTYTPHDGFHGSDTFSYTATAGGETSDPPAQIDVIVDNAPTCPDVTVNVISGNSLELAPTPCSDPDGDALWIGGDSLPEHGTIERTGPTSFVYTPDPGFVGTDFALFFAEDDFLASDDALLTINVTNPPPPPPPPPPPVHPDTTPPVANLGPVPGQKLKQVLATGLHLALTSNEAGSATVIVTVDAKTARKLHIKREVGRASASVPAGKLDLTVRLTAKARKAFKTIRKVKLAVTAVVTDAAGNPTSRSMTVALKR